MKVHLLHPDRNFTGVRLPPWHEAALVQDLGLDAVFGAMARGDAFLLDVCSQVTFSAFGNDVETIAYRQRVLRDCLTEPAMARSLYDLSVEAREAERNVWFLGSLDKHPDWVLHHSIGLLEVHRAFLVRLRTFAETHAGHVTSEGWSVLFASLRRELTDEYLATIDAHLAQLKFPHGVRLSARLDHGNKGVDYTLHRVPPGPRRLWAFLPGWFGRRIDSDDVFRFSIHPRDEAGGRGLRELRERGVADVAKALGRSADHVRSFFEVLRRELAFYVGCLNLHDRLAAKGEPVSFPTPRPAEKRRLSFRGLYDVSLSLRIESRAVGNDADADGRDLIVVTGPNQGGKSTFLRSIGLAQLMMQCGCFAPADSFTASTRDAIFTHYRREEDVTMERGKLDEELRRMSEIVDHVTPRSMILFNESFAATNEREGSEIARQIVSSLLERHVRMAFVTHQYDFAHGLHGQRNPNVLFLRAERDGAGGRTFKLREGAPLPTSFGEDLYEAIFGGGVR